MAVIQTKFDVHDLIMHKYSYGTDENSVMLFEVIDVKGHKCYGGTQCFVSCRGIRIQYKNNYPKAQTEEVECISVAVYRNEDYPQFKEDEMIFAPTEYIELIQKHTNS